MHVMFYCPRESTLIINSALTYKTHILHSRVYYIQIYSLFKYKISYTLTFTRYWVNCTLKAFTFMHVKMQVYYQLRAHVCTTRLPMDKLMV